MEQGSIIVLIIFAAAVVSLGVYLVLRKFGGRFSAKAKYGKAELDVSAESNQTQQPPAGQITIKDATAKGGSIDARTDKGGKIEVERATAKSDIKTSTTGSEPSPPKA